LQLYLEEWGNRREKHRVCEPRKGASALEYLDTASTVGEDAMIRIGPLFAIVLIAIHAVGCGTLGKALNALDKSTDKITKNVVPGMDEVCLETAKICAAECKEKNAAASQPTEKVTGDQCKKDCEAYQKAKKKRDIFYASVNSIHTSINVAIGFLQMGDEDKARQIYKKIVAELPKVYKLAEDAGFTLK
jgi:hypothetical protein